MDTFDHLDEQFADAVHVQAVEIGALPLREMVQDPRSDFIGQFCAVHRHQIGTHPEGVLGQGTRPSERQMRIVVVFRGFLGDPVEQLDVPIRRGSVDAGHGESSGVSVCERTMSAGGGVF
ncbi:hypothetical protein FHX42_003595 [Saccharopolyspora lacisalsi]|uniref:Uncharacterized protein n=1 Tax=Halosaccharopolyspora lacisalsi TaxID=1000566 RepID=A0A839DZV7_9PSEU|nr:hypothetical protein [Halosaccharopolyspora lacisalsi]MBA8826219.1 hypothetical protein [Halosaccharopolyspora lacisalsi]